jgi:hypothetical protein
VTPPSTIPRSWPKWLLFAVFLLVVPVPYYMVVVGGLLPPFCILYIAVHGLLVALPKFTMEGFVILGILWAHVVIFGGLLYLGATGISWVLFRVFPARFALTVVFLMIVALLVAANFEIYRVPGHNSAPPADIFRIIREFIS